MPHNRINYTVLFIADKCWYKNYFGKHHIEALDTTVYNSFNLSLHLMFVAQAKRFFVKLISMIYAK